MIAKFKSEVEEVKNMENSDEKENKREIVIPGEEIISGAEYLPGDGTRREGNKIIASRFGLTDISGRLIKIIPLSGVYIPRPGNVVIGRVVDITFNGWLLDIKAPYSSFLPVSEAPRFIRGDLSEFYDIGDMIVCKVDSVKRKGIDLTAKLRGLGKLEDGMIIFINSNKVPRVIGREGSMVKIIKDNTKCDIVVGQNGVVWIKGENVDSELKAKDAINYVVNKSYIEGLTDKVKEWFENGGK